MRGSNIKQHFDTCIEISCGGQQNRSIFRSYCAECKLVSSTSMFGPSKVVGSQLDERNTVYW